MLRVLLKYDNGYLPIMVDTYPMWILGMFLTTDVIGENTWQNWAKDPLKIGTSSNVTALDKIGNNVRLFLMSDTNDFLINPEQYSITMSLSQFIYVINEWQNLKKQKSLYIIITEQDNGQYNILSSDKEPKNMISKKLID